MHLLLISFIFSGLFLGQEPAELWRQGERARAVEAQRSALKSEEDPVAHEQLVEWALTIHQYRAALEDSRQLGDAGRSLRGRAHYFLGEYEEALRLLDEGDGTACLMRLEALRALGREAEADDTLMRAERVAPRSHWGRRASRLLAVAGGT